MIVRSMADGLLAVLISFGGPAGPQADPSQPLLAAGWAGGPDHEEAGRPRSGGPQ